MTTITSDDLGDIALGAAILGTGGGGDPHIGKLFAKQVIKEHGPIDVIDPSALDQDDLIIPTAQVGAPTVAVEKLPGGLEATRAFRRVAAEFDRPVTATMPVECGGINSMIPLAVAARCGLPVVDADGMGRAFPELQHETFNIYGISGTPAAVTDEYGDTCLIEVSENTCLETFTRNLTVEMGGVSYVADYPMSGTEVNETAIPNTVTLARDLGRAVHSSSGTGVDAIKHVTRESTHGEAKSLFEGKIVDVDRRTEGGFAIGEVKITGLEADDGNEYAIEFQNENLVARQNGSAIAVVPDLITVLDRETSHPIPTESLRYGDRVRVVGIPTPPIMRTDAALAVWGPQSFDLDIEFSPLEHETR